MKNKREALSSNYLFFSFHIEYLLLLLPPIVGIWSFVFSNHFHLIEIFTPELIRSLLEKGIDDYIIAEKICTYVIIAYFFTHKWTAMKSDGNFAFWIALGINRRKFFIRTILKFFTLILLGQVLGLAIVLYFNYYMSDPLYIFVIVLGLASHLLLALALSLILSSIMDQPEISSLGYLFIMMIIYFLFIDNTSVFNKIFHSDLQYKFETGWISMLGALVLSVILYTVSYRIYSEMDIST